RCLAEGRSEPRHGEGVTSPLEMPSERILALVCEHPDLILDEMVLALRKRRIPASRSALSRFFARHDVTVKKKSAGGGAEASRRGSGAPPLGARDREST